MEGFETGFMIGTPLLALTLFFVYSWLKENSTDPLNKAVFTVQVFVLPFLALFPFVYLAQTAFYRSVMILFATLLFFPFIVAMWNLIKQIMQLFTG